VKRARKEWLFIGKTRWSGQNALFLALNWLLCIAVEIYREELL